ncbi:hypothetical protein SAMN05421837_12153 [Amycolatopsis pretoriensis]|uniref:DUF3592 domain-containing protein n=1 Tax=Amycolatopsis pretoriensis TaxID=218821 RepID=A0A1H5RJ80_9PSEU|nr:hypothetical protein [Amycolatopsis pretoriensis]SEF38422.1 hypothetical protein SAMN05421837_12153 [Amycolatopsis pretoriensis]
MSTAPNPVRPAALLRGSLGGGVSGATLSAFITGIVLERVPLILLSLGLPLVYGVLLFLAGMPRRAREAAVVPHVALAKIESLRAGGTETGDVPVDLVITIAPGYEPSFRTGITHHVNLVDLPRYRTGDILVVEYPPDRPWQAKVVPPPTAEWERRVADAVVQPAPESSLVQEPPEGWGYAFFAFAGLLLGAAIVLGLFRVELFRPEPAEPPSSSSSSTATVGPRESAPDTEELRAIIESLARRAEIPADRIPDLVRQATSTLAVGWPRTWQITVVRAPDTVTVRITATGPGGSASLVVPPR